MAMGRSITWKKGKGETMILRLFRRISSWEKGKGDLNLGKKIKIKKKIGAGKNIKQQGTLNIPGYCIPYYQLLLIDMYLICDYLD